MGAPEFPYVCVIPFAGSCIMTGTWSPFFWPFAYFIVEGTNGVLDVVALDGTGNFWPATGTRSGVSVSIGTSGDPFQFSGTLTSCDSMQGPDPCALLQRSAGTCGDGILQPNAEQCDDGNHTTGR